MLSVTARPPAVRLSPRELEILELLRRGHAPKEIASRLELSIWTVRDHIASARAKFDAPTTVRLVALFARAPEERRTSRSEAPPSD